MTLKIIMSKYVNDDDYFYFCLNSIYNIIQIQKYTVWDKHINLHSLH